MLLREFYAKKRKQCSCHNLHIHQLPPTFSKTKDSNERKAFVYDWGDVRKIETGAVGVDSVIFYHSSYFKKLWYFLVSTKLWFNTIWRLFPQRLYDVIDISKYIRLSLSFLSSYCTWHSGYTSTYEWKKLLDIDFIELVFKEAFVEANWTTFYLELNCINCTLYEIKNVSVSLIII